MNYGKASKEHDLFVVQRGRRGRGTILCRNISRLLRRLLSHLGRILEINGLELVTRQVVEAARESLVIGAG